MPSREEIDYLLARNPYARYLDERARATEAEAAAAVFSDPNTTPTVNRLVDRILHAPPSAYHHWGRKGSRNSNKWPGTIRFTIDYLVTAIGAEHFTPKQQGIRQVLREESELKTHGLRAGLPQGLYDWLVDAAKPEGTAEGSVEESVEPDSYYMPEEFFKEARKEFKKHQKKF